jgi:4-carboxymuconolactone decarboxylase
MARVSFVEKGQADPLVEDLYKKIEARGQSIINLYKVLGHTPYIGLNWQRLGNSILRGEELSPKLRELAILRVGSLAKAWYEFSKHSVGGLRAGLTQTQIDAIHDWPGSKEFSDEERAVLAYTDEVARDIKVTDATFALLKERFTEHQIVELTVVIGYYGMVSRFLVALDIDIEE